MRSDDPEFLARRMLAAVIAYLSLLDEEWDPMSDEERHLAVRLALEAARRPINRRPTSQ